MVGGLGMKACIMDRTGRRVLEMERAAVGKRRAEVDQRRQLRGPRRCHSGQQ